MPVTVNVNDLSVIHQTSNGIATATIPDVCQTPGPAGPVPIPYPNIAMSSDLVGGTTSVTVDGSSAAIQGSKFIKSTGDEPGAAGGVMSAVFAMEATFLSFSPTVTFDGKPACRLTDKMLMNKGNTVCMGGAVNPFLAPPGPDAQSGIDASFDPSQAKQCVLRGVLVSCGHGKRKLMVDLAKHDITALQVVSKASEPDKLTVEWDGDCGFGTPNCPQVGVVIDGAYKAIDKATGTVEMEAPSTSPVSTAITIFKLLTTQKFDARNYRTITSRVCNGHAPPQSGAGQWLQVQVFPEVEWSAKMTLGYKHGDPKDKKSGLHYDEQATWTIGGEFEGKLGSQTYKLDMSAGAKSDAFPMFGTLLKHIGWLSKVLESMASYGADFKVSPRWPLWTIGGGGMKLVELPGKPIVGTEGDFKFGFDPLIGLEFKVSILDWLIRFAGSLAGPPGAILAQALVQVRQRFAKGAGDAESATQASLDIDIQLTVGGEIRGGFGVKFSDGKSEIDSDASSVGGSLDIGVEGHVIGKGRVWRIEVTGAGKIGAGGAEGGGPSKITGTLTPSPGKNAYGIKGKLTFNGLAFYYLLYLEVGASGAESKKGKEEDEEGVTEVKPSYKKTLAEKKGTAVLLKPWTVPESHE